MRKRDMVVYGIALVLAFVVGVLVGGQCAQAPPPAPPEPIAATCDPIREVVYECPPEPVEPTPPPARGAAAAKPKPRALPAAEKPITPQQRQRLLAWVRDQSADLQGCRSAAKDTYRLTVTLAVDEAGKVSQVRFNAPPAELPADVLGCLRDRIRAWTPPTELTEGRRELVFGLTL